MRFLGTRANQKNFRAKLRLVTHENGPMRFFLFKGNFGSCGTKAKTHILVSKFLRQPVGEEEKGEKKRKRGEKGEGRRKSVGPRYEM